MDMVYYVDSDRDCRDRIKTLADGVTRPFEVCTDGGSLLHRLNGKTNGIGCVVMDMGVHEICCAQIIARVHEKDGRIPVVLMTGDDSLESERQARRLGIFYLLKKPFTDDEFLQVVENAIAQRDTLARK